MTTLSPLQLSTETIANELACWKAIEPALPKFIQDQRWYASKAIGIASARVVSALPVSLTMALAIIEVTNQDRSTERYVLPLAYAGDHDVRSICRLDSNFQSVVVFEASHDAEFWSGLLKSLRNTPLGHTVATNPKCPAWSDAVIDRWHIEIQGGEQSNTSVVLGDGYFLKLFRRVIPGINPDVEVGRFLSHQTDFRNSPAVLKTLDWTVAVDSSACLLMISQRVDCVSNAWSFALNRLDEFWRRVLHSSSTANPTQIDWSIAALDTAIDESVTQFMGDFISDVTLLGQRTREMHHALGSGPDPAFATEPIDAREFDQLIIGIQNELQITCDLLKRVDLPINDPGDLAKRMEAKATALLDELCAGPPGSVSTKIRVHGDYHLGQVLRTASDFFIIDFEGEPDRPLSERRTKRSALKDVAGMIRSLHYASNAASIGLIASLRDVEKTATIVAWQSAWFQASAHSFLRGYFEAGKTQQLGSRDFDPIASQRLFDLYLLEKSLYELRYEINNRPDWVQIPLRGLIELLSLGG